MAHIESAKTKSRFDYFGTARRYVSTIDPVLWTILGVIALVALLDLPSTVPVLVFTGSALADIAIFILLSVGLAAGLKATSADQMIAKAFSGNTGRAVFLASIFGALSPFCSCGVVPIIAALLASGVPLAPVMAFMMASPIMDPEMFILTAAVISPEFAVAKTVAAIAMGLLGGAAVLALRNSAALQSPLLSVKTSGVSCGASCGASYGGSAAPEEEKVHWTFWREERRRSLFRRELFAAGWFLGKWLTLAFVLEAIMVTYVPMQDVGAWLAGLGAWAIPASALVGVPSYLNGYAAIPLTDALMEHGLSAGAALSFMTAGAVTSIPAAVAVKALVRGPVFMLYLALAFIGSLGVGFSYLAILSFA